MTSLSHRNHDKSFKVERRCISKRISKAHYLYKRGVYKREIKLPDSQIVPESSQSFGASVIVSFVIISLMADAKT